MARRRRRQCRRGAQLVLEKADAAAGEHLRIDRAGSRHDVLDIRGQLGLGPQHSIDAELFEVAVRAGNEIRARHQADRCRVGHPVGDRAGDDVDLVESGAGDEELRVLDAGAPQHVVAGATADDELDVDRAERIGDGAIEVDDDDLVVRRERAGQR